MLYDLIIIGGGPAGITAGIYGARRKIKTLLVSRDFLGQVAKTSRVDNWPGSFAFSGTRLMKSFEEHLRRFEDGKSLTIIQGLVKNLQRADSRADSLFSVRLADGEHFDAKTIIIATGRKPRPLGVAGGKELEGKGVSYCSICDAPFFAEKVVAVIGGGNAGFEAALDLALYAKRIYIIEKNSQPAADEILQEAAEKEKKISVLFNKEIRSIEGEEKVEAIKYLDIKTKKEINQPVDGVFAAVGSLAVIDFLDGLVELDEQGEIKVEPLTCQSSLPGLFAAGDVNNKPFKQIVTASADGCRAALSAYQYLQNVLSS